MLGTMTQRLLTHAVLCLVTLQHVVIQHMLHAFAAEWQHPGKQGVYKGVF